MNYNCICLKCKNSFTSDNEADFDGEAFCPKCTANNKEIAAKVDAIIAQKRTVVKPKVEIYDLTAIRNSKKSVNNYINIRNLGK